MGGSGWSPGGSERFSVQLFLHVFYNSTKTSAPGPLVAVRLEEGKGPHTEDPRRRSASGGHRTVVC